MTIVLRELRAHLKGLLLWSGSMLLFMYLMFTEFTAYYDNPEMAAILDSMPQGLLEAFGMANANLTTINGYLSVMALYIYIMLGIYAILLGCNIVAKEERDKTAEFLMTLPVTRVKILISKIIASAINILILTSISMASIVAIVQKYDPDSSNYRFIWLLFLATLVIQMIFFSLGFMIAACLKRFKRASGFSVAVVIITYLLSIIMTLSDHLEFLKYITPFKYFEGAAILKNDGFSLPYLIISFSIIVLATLTTFWVYPKRDLR